MEQSEVPALEAGIDAKQQSDASMPEAEVVYVEHMRIMMNQEVFLIPLKSVLSIIRPTTLTPVLMAPAHLMGLANIRGQIFCLVDPGKALGLSKSRNEKSTGARFLLLRHPRVNLGIWVEDVVGLYQVNPATIEEAASKSYEAGRVKTKNGTFPVLRVDALFD